MASSVFITPGMALTVTGSGSNGAVTINAERLNLGGTSVTYPSMIRGGGSSTVYFTNPTSSVVAARAAISALEMGSVVALSSGTPTISSGFGTSPSIVAGKAHAFTLNVGTGGTATTGVIGLPTAANGWVCHVENITAQAANRASVRTCMTASTTTTVTIQNQNVATGAATAWAASDILHIIVMAY